MTVHARPGFDPAEAEENSRAKAVPIARHAWRLGLTFDDLARLPYSDKTDRSAPTLRRLATAAFRASPDPADRRRNPPHSRTSDTWRHVRAELADLEDRARYGHPDAVPRTLLDERDAWTPTAVRRPVVDVHLPDGPPEEIPADIPPVDFDPAEAAARLAEADRLAERETARRPRPVDLAAYGPGDAPALVTSGARPRLPGDPTPGAAPRGWDTVTALPPLDPARPCRWCGAPAVIGTLNGWRCQSHPPVRGDPRGDWGWALNWQWVPGRVCPPGACWCGRCTRYDPGGAPMRSLRPGAATT